ncbi:MAG: hypothetical protein ACK4G4_12300, partial [Thermus sp.]|uniref:hypothetical protein n=1 Tax=Thermus sp. TaxID=275 RepID=UPI003918F597
IFYGEEARITLNHYGEVGISPKGLRFNSRFFPWVETEEGLSLDVAEVMKSEDPRLVIVRAFLKDFMRAITKVRRWLRNRK